MANPENKRELDLEQRWRKLVKRISSVQGFPQAALPALENFVSDVYLTTGPSTLVVKKKENFDHRPTLEFFVVWPLFEDSFSDAQEEKIEELGQRHDELSRSLFPVFDSSIHILQFPPEKSGIESVSQDIVSSKVIASAQLRR